MNLMTPQEKILLILLIMKIRTLYGSEERIKGMRTMLKNCSI